MEKFRNDLEEINFPMQLIEAAPLEDILLKPGIGRLHLLQWCLLNISDSGEVEICPLGDDDQLQNRVLKMAVSYGLCSKGEDHQKVFLGVDGNMKHQTEFWNKMFDCVKATQGSEDAIEHSLENCGKSSQFIHELMNSSDFKESLNIKMNLIPADMQVHLNGVPSGVNGTLSGVNGTSSGVNGTSSGVNGTSSCVNGTSSGMNGISSDIYEDRTGSEDVFSEEDRLKWMSFPIVEEVNYVLVKNRNQLDVDCENVTDGLQKAQQTYRSTYKEEFAPITSLAALVTSPTLRAQCAELEASLTRIDNVANTMMQYMTDETAMVESVVAISGGPKVFRAHQENCDNKIAEIRGRLRTICQQFELNKTYK